MEFVRLERTLLDRNRAWFLSLPLTMRPPFSSFFLDFAVVLVGALVCEGGRVFVEGLVEGGGVLAEGLVDGGEVFLDDVVEGWRVFADAFVGEGVGISRGPGDGTAERLGE